MARGGSRAQSEVTGSPPKKTGDNTAFWQDVAKGINVSYNGQYTRTKGDKAKFGDVVEVKKDILKDLKEAQKSNLLQGDLPNTPEIKRIGGTTSKFAGGQSLDLKVELDPNHPAVTEQIALRKEVDAARNNGQRDVDMGDLRMRVRKYNETYGEQLDTLLSRVRLAAGRYNDVDSDLQTDYYSTNFFLQTKLQVAGVKGWQGEIYGKIGGSF
jgi:hypothetical protein